jgi:hypothetical protein
MLDIHEKSIYLFKDGQFGLLSVYFLDFCRHGNIKGFGFEVEFNKFHKRKVDGNPLMEEDTV